MTPFTVLELEQLWTAAGGSADADAVSAAVALAESGGDPSVIHNTAYPDRPNYSPPVKGAQPEYSIGLWQINQLAHSQYTTAELLTPSGNARAAIAISSNGADWSPWSTYTSGAYKQYLPGAQEAASGATGGPGDLTGAKQVRALGGWAHLQTAVGESLPFALHHGRDRLDDARALLRKIQAVR